MKIAIRNDLQIILAPDFFLQELRTRLTIENSKWIKNEKMGRWNRKTPRYLRYYKEAGNELSVLRGFIRQLINMLKLTGISYQVVDHRRVLSS